VNFLHKWDLDELPNARVFEIPDEDWERGKASVFKKIAGWFGVGRQDTTIIFFYKNQLFFLPKQYIIIMRGYEYASTTPESLSPCPTRQAKSPSVRPGLRAERGIAVGNK
jgi:hypothetical protein